MLRMEIACFLILAFVALLYFSAQRRQTKLHKTFSLLLVVVLIHLIFDGVTLYTVNHLDTVPLLLNDILHRGFIGTMILVEYLFYAHISFLVEEETGDCGHFRVFSKVYFVMAEILILILPVSYKVTSSGNYEAGIHANVSYVSVAVYILLCIGTLARYWKQIHMKKKFAIATALGIEVMVSVLQGLNGSWLISGMGITLMTLSFYLTVENPDVLLLEQVREEKRKAEEANASKTAFLSIVSHEIRTPMNAVIGMTELLLRDDLTDKQRKYLLNIKNSGEALVMIVNDILDQSKIEAGKMDIVEDAYELRSMLDDVRMIIENRIAEKPIHLIYDIDEHIPKIIVGDALRMRQILINLMNNAVKFTEQGYIELGIRIVKEEDERLLLRFSVKDSGQGIRQEDMNRLFKAFSQVDTKKNHSKEGTGLGLSISADFVHMMGGQLDVASEYGKGSEFFFTVYQGLPEMDEEREPLKKPAWQSDKFTAPGAKILIVDDSEINLMITESLLESLQMKIDTAESGMKALEMIQKNQYHAVFMDYMMPYMDGVETTEKVRRLAESAAALRSTELAEYYKSVPIIALTGDASEETKEKFKLAGIDDYTEKPVMVDQLKKILLKWLPENLILHND
ncbi:MAG: ATP-binding protein [Roseburia sp.]|nr:ATP-binding protein [Roseburia sp.]